VIVGGSGRLISTIYRRPLQKTSIPSPGAADSSHDLRTGKNARRIHQDDKSHIQ
jgi:hypothetical protein